MRALLLLTFLGFSCLVSSVRAQSPAPTSPVVADILKLSKAKVDESVIVNYVERAPHVNVTATDLMELHSNGISSRVLLALLNSRPAEPTQMAASTENRPPASDQAPAAPAAQASTAAPPSPASPDKMIPIVIVSVRSLPGRETSFTTKDGATWVQTDSQRIYGLPDPPFDAELKPGAVGSTFLVPKTGSRAIRVKLVER